MSVETARDRFERWWAEVEGQVALDPNASQESIAWLGFSAAVLAMYDESTEEAEPLTGESDR